MKRYHFCPRPVFHVSVFVCPVNCHPREWEIEGDWGSMGLESGWQTTFQETSINSSNIGNRYADDNMLVTVSTN